MKLYEINEQLEDLVDPETGELLDYDAFDALQMERIHKIESMILWYKNMISEAFAVKTEASELTRRQKCLENRAERLKCYIERELSGEKFSTPRCTVSYRLSSSVDIHDADAVVDWARKSGHSELIIQKPPEVSKKAVADLLKAGVEVPQTQIVKKRNMVVK